MTIIKFSKEKMLDKNKHKLVLVEILKEIYSDVELRTILGFKGGTAAFLFYDLPRLSVDLDFDLLDLKKKELTLRKIKVILSRFGQVEDIKEKRYTLFGLLNYGKGERKIKVEISKRKSIALFKLRQYLGISMLVMEKEDMAAGKLSALITRKKLASRDIFDLWFFLKNNWQINEKIVEEKTGLSLIKALKKAKKIVKGVPRTYLLQGMGELLEENQKQMVKEKMRGDLIFRINMEIDRNRAGNK